MIDIEGESLGTVGCRTGDTVVVVPRWAGLALLGPEIEVIWHKAGNTGLAIPERSFVPARAHALASLVSIPRTMIAILLTLVSGLAEISSSGAVHAFLVSHIVVGGRA